jgi:transposase InsO family protein
VPCPADLVDDHEEGPEYNGKRLGPAVHDDLVRRQFSAPAPNVVWLTDITEHPTVEGKVYVCAIKDVFPNRIVGYAIDQRMTAQLAVSALPSAIARRQPAGTVIVHSDRGGQFVHASSGPSTFEQHATRIAHGAGELRPTRLPR